MSSPRPGSGILNQRRRDDRRAISIKPQKKMSPAKARLLGFLAGDGCIAERRGRAINTACSLLEWIKKAVLEVYGVYPSWYTTPESVDRNEPLTSLYLCRDIALDLHSLSTWGMHTWRVPRAVLGSSQEVKSRYVRGFFDAEGNVYIGVRFGKRHSRVAATSVNKKGLEEVGLLLSSLGIDHRLYPRPGHFKLQIHKRSEVVKFADLVGFESPDKSRSLKKVREFPQVRARGDVFRERLGRIFELGLEDEAAPAVAATLGCSVKQVWDARSWAKDRAPFG